MRDVDSCSLHDNKECIEKSVNKNTRSNSDTQIMILQKSSNISDYKYLFTSINKHEHDQLLAPMFEKVETGEEEKFENIKAISSDIDARMQNNLKEEVYFEGETFEKTDGLLGNLKRSNRRKRAFSFLDSLVSMSIVGPLVIGFWRGIWTLMNLHTELFPSWLCFTFGAALHAIFAIFQKRFHNIYTDKWTKLNTLKRSPYVASRILYTYIFGVACNAHWRGGWIIIDDYLFTHIWITTCLMCLLLACLAILRCIRNLIAPPLIILIDTPIRVFQFPTRYNVGAEQRAFVVYSAFIEDRETAKSQLCSIPHFA